ncbi:MAG: PqqD family protein [Campylobacterota bacterium]|nr:PqqD family protein [Campylobacterota bacterium]
MGFFSKVWNGVKNTVKKVAKAVVDTVKDPIGTAKKVWNGITGKSTFDEAEVLIKDIEDRYDKAKFEYEKDVQDILSQLEVKINTINYHKKDVFDNHFDRFKNIGDRLHNINIEGKSFLEYFDDSITEIKVQDGVKARVDLYEIDFNNLSFTDIGFGIITLGFSTRKKAKQTLIKVQEEEVRIDEEIAKMKSQVIKLKVILKSIDNVAEYFEVLIQSYSKLLDRFTYGISSQILKTTVNNKKLENGKLDFKLMPIVHIEEFQALFNLSIVLKQMATMGYLNQDGEIEDTDIEAVNNIKFKVEQLELMAS